MFEPMCISFDCEFVLHHLIPGIGCLTALWIFIAPFKSVRKIDKTDSLDNVNPFPFPMIMANCLGWLVYGLLVQDPYVFFPNIVGYQLGVYYTLTSYRVSGKDFQSRVIQILVVSSVLVFSGAFVSFIVLNGAYPARTIMGLVCVMILAVFYSAPLSGFYSVIKNKDASSIDPILAAASLVNGSLWSIYGLALGDAFIWSPNLLGVVFCVVQFVLMAVYPNRSPYEPPLLQGTALQAIDLSDDVL
ncbi:hypothetical protein BASA50_008520 [Batrachochytrium salamandrivorans]|uniref:Bidirectional sugar transporter SWEET n=1 Tax=Batrachochytrium salamandrivorans TaxID=1357716 RepID=A0ABQ8F3X0_9FUNG|nr:hypothetical protein BASA50_008520 [Batrachochytrium salamandrivorans]